MNGYWNLETFWFALICVLWIGYLFLEGFDYGVGMLLRVLGKDDEERRSIIHSIGPVWDGNEVWLLTAGGATFAAFPEWYATMFSGFYLALVLMLVALIIRGVAFEFWGKSPDRRWRTVWEWAIIVGSAVPALLVGVALANVVHGVPIDAQGEYTGNLLTLLGPYALLGGVTTLLLCLAHGASFLTLKTQGVVAVRAGRVAQVTRPLAALAVAGFAVWTLADSRGIGVGAVIAAVVAVAAAIGAAAVGRLGRQAWAFGAGGVAIAATVAMLFCDLYPNVMTSSTDPAYSLTVFSASSTHYTLTVMTVVALVLTPVVLAYQTWTYYVFRKRLGREEAGPPVGEGAPGAAG